MGDWTAEAADTLEQVVATVRDRTVTPARAVAKAIVYGLLTAFIVGAALTFLAIGAFRLLDVVIPAGVWAAYFIVGGMLVIGGVFAWARRNAVKSDGSGATDAKDR